jgi:hypothetical protein
VHTASIIRARLKRGSTQTLHGTISQKAIYIMHIKEWFKLDLKFLSYCITKSSYMFHSGQFSGDTVSPKCTYMSHNMKILWRIMQIRTMFWEIIKIDLNDPHRKSAAATNKLMPLLDLSHTVMKHSMSKSDKFPVALLILTGEERCRSCYPPDKTRHNLLCMPMTHATGLLPEFQTGRLVSSGLVWYASVWSKP